MSRTEGAAPKFRRITSLPVFLLDDARTMFQIKICGITRVCDAVAAADAGADAIGLNFFAGSSRNVSPLDALSIVEAVAGRALAVGVFVNSPAEEIAQIADQLKLDAVQLHGDEPASILRALPQRRVIKAFRVGSDGLAPLRAWFDDAMRGALYPEAVLIDGCRPGEYGGTGQIADWSAAAAYTRTPNMPPLVLAGGLRPENVAEAIVQVRPTAVDTAGGVETAPGIKCPNLINAFVAAARCGFNSLKSR